MSNYAELSKHEAVKEIEFIGGGVGVVTLNPGFGNPNVDGYHSAEQTFHAASFAAAQKFVDGAEASRYARSGGPGKPCRVKDGTPLSCNPHSETYWCM